VQPLASDWQGGVTTGGGVGREQPTVQVGVGEMVGGDGEPGSSGGVGGLGGEDDGSSADVAGSPGGSGVGSSAAGGAGVGARLTGMIAGKSAGGASAIWRAFMSVGPPALIGAVPWSGATPSNGPAP